MGELRDLYWIIQYSIVKVIVARLKKYATKMVRKGKRRITLSCISLFFTNPEAIFKLMASQIAASGFPKKSNCCYDY